MALPNGPLEGLENFSPEMVADLSDDRSLVRVSDEMRWPNTLVPRRDDLPEVLPTDRLNPIGMPRGELRIELRRIPTVRNATNVFAVWIQSFGLLVAACWLGHPIVWVAAFFLMGRAMACFAILSHEAAHRLLFSNRRANDWVGRWLLAYPAFIPFDVYRRSHMAHHRDELGPNEPDKSLYAGYPITKASWHRKLRRDAFGESGWKNLRGLLIALTKPSSRGTAASILVPHVVIFTMFALSGRWWVWPTFWLLPWMTVWRVLNRLRAIAEHGGMVRSKDRRETTHVIEQHFPARFWMVPYNTGWHLAHHVDCGVPFQNLPRLHEELVACGWVTPAITYPSYTALWRKASSR